MVENRGRNRCSPRHKMGVRWFLLPGRESRSRPAAVIGNGTTSRLVEKPRPQLGNVRVRQPSRELVFVAVSGGVSWGKGRPFHRRSATTRTSVF